MYQLFIVNRVRGSEAENHVCLIKFKVLIVRNVFVKTNSAPYENTEKTFALDLFASQFF